MDVAATFTELYGRVNPLARSAVEGLTPDQLNRAPAGATNSIGWLIWHLARVQDHHMAEILDQDQVWVADTSWAPHFGLDSDPSNIGYGHSADDAAEVRPDGPEPLLGYLDTVEARTFAYLQGLRDVDLDRVVDRRWDPPVTLGVRLISIADDSLQHVGQACYLRGLFGW